MPTMCWAFHILIIIIAKIQWEPSRLNFPQIISTAYNEQSSEAAVSGILQMQKLRFEKVQ